MIKCQKAPCNSSTVSQNHTWGFFSSLPTSNGVTSGSTSDTWIHKVPWIWQETPDLTDGVRLGVKGEWFRTAENVPDGTFMLRTLTCVFVDDDLLSLICQKVSGSETAGS